MEDLSREKIRVDVREIVLYSRKKDSFCDVFIYEPENIEEQELGNLYIIGEVTNLSENSSYLVNLLASIIKKEFYSKLRRSTVESLEAGLHKVNTTLSNLAEQGNIDWVGNLNMICGAYKDREFHFSQVGKVKTLLIRNNQITDIGKNATGEEEPHPFRTFANIASGQLEANDLILFATSELFNIFSLEKIRQMCSSLDIEELAEKIQDSLEREEEVDTAGVLILKMEEEKEKSKLSHIEIKPETEIVKMPQEKKMDPCILFEKKEKKTQNEEAIDTTDKKKISLEDIIKEYESIEVKRREDKEEKTRIEVEKMAIGSHKHSVEREEKEIDDDFLELGDEKERIKVLNNISKVLWNISCFARRKIRAAITSFSKKLTEKIKEVAQKKQGTETDIPEKKSIRLARSSSLLIIAVLVFSVLVASLVLTDYKRKEEKKMKFYSGLLSQAERKFDKAEEALIYKDSRQARLLLAEAKDLASRVSEYENLRKEALILLSKVRNQLDTVDLVKKIEEPEIVADLGKENSDYQQIEKIGNDYYIFGPQSGLSKIDLNSKKNNIQPIKLEGIENVKLASAFSRTEEIVFLTQTNEVELFNLKKEKPAHQKIEFSSKTPKVIDIATYSNYMYLLEPHSNQIYKYRKTPSGFGREKLWITDPEADIGNAISMAIDGFIYVLKSNGTVEKYLTGTKKKFSIEKLGDPILKPTKIYTEAGLKYLYIIEPKKKRIILFDKTSGKLVGQYVSDSFNSLKDIIAADKKETAIYALSGSKIFKIKISK